MSKEKPKKKVLTPEEKEAAIKALNIVVEVGLVVGTIPAKTPNGAAILTWPL